MKQKSRKFDQFRWLLHPRQRAWYLVSVGVALVVVAGYLGTSRRCGELGFPLDDAWIHQTYARNLARTGRLIYASEQVSLGSTSPLWTALLSVGHLLRVPPVPWAFTLGILSWLSLAWVSVALARQLFPEARIAALLAGLACLVEWHLAWAALSGLEITLFVLLALLMIERYLAGARRVWVGLIGGALVWTRPEGIVLVALLIGAIALEGVCVWRCSRWNPGLWRGLFGVVAGFIALWLPYVTLNLLVSGQIFPGTYYAKQAEYQELLAQPVWLRLWGVVWQPLVGAQVLLVPGFVWQIVLEVQQWVSLMRGFTTRQGTEGRAKTTDPGLSCLALPVGEGQTVDSSVALVRMLPVAWWFVYHLIYALRLPVAYQHGRYLMPTIPILLLYGVVGTMRWGGAFGGRPYPAWARLLKRALMLALCCLFVAFLVLGGQAFANDVCIIRCEMVQVALWLRANTSPGVLVAAHDIGAIGYWAERPLIDLAGLVTPEAVPFIRDETRLLAFLVNEGADYVATFPSWYPLMVQEDRLVRVYQTGCLATRIKGGDNMAVYRVDR